MLASAPPQISGCREGLEGDRPNLVEFDFVAARYLNRSIQVEFAADSPLEGDGFELVWGFSCQVVIFRLLSVLCSEREGRSSSRRLRSGSRSARKGSRDRNASKAWRLAA